MLMEPPRVIPEDRIRAIAHELWLQDGCPDGRADEHWTRASELAAAEAASEDVPAASRKRKAAPKKKAAKHS